MTFVGGAPDRGALRNARRHAGSLRAIIEKRLEQFNIEKSVISEALNFAVQSPAEVTSRFLQGVAGDGVLAGRAGF